jgi:hypothetical protein
MHAGPFLWIILAMAGVTVVPRGLHPRAGVCLFVFSPPLVGAELGPVWHSYSFFLKVPCLFQHPAAD